MRACGFEVLDLLEIRAPDDLAELRGRRACGPRFGEEVVCGADLAGPQDGPILTCPLKLAFRLSPKLIPSGVGDELKQAAVWIAEVDAGSVATSSGSRHRTRLHFDAV